MLTAQLNNESTDRQRVIALVGFVEYVREFYQSNFEIMPVAFQTVDSEAEAVLRDVGAFDEP